MKPKLKQTYPIWKLISSEKSVSKQKNTLSKIKYIRSLLLLNEEYLFFRRFGLELPQMLLMFQNKLIEVKTLQFIDLTGCRVGDQGLSFLLSQVDNYSRNLTSLVLEDCSVGRQTIEKTVNILEKNLTPLRTLNLANNNLDDNTVFDILLGTSKNITLKELKINGNKLDKKSFTTIGTILKIDRKLKLLDISKSGLSDKFASVISRGLINNNCLEVLLMNYNNLTSECLIVSL